MRHKNHEQFNQKVQKFRRQIRNRQIEEYKQKIRAQYKQHQGMHDQNMGGQDNNGVWFNNENKENYGERYMKQQMGRGKQMYERMEGICNTIQNLQEQFFLIMQWQQSQQINKSQREMQYQQLKQDINFQYDLLIILLVQNQVQNNQQYSNSRQSVENQQFEFRVYRKISKLSKVGLHLWKGEQRCRISLQMQGYLLRINQKYRQQEGFGSTKTQREWDSQTEKIEIVLQYVLNILELEMKHIRPVLYQHTLAHHIENHSSNIFDFNLIQQSIIMQLVFAISSLLQNTDIPMSIQNDIFKILKFRKQYNQQNEIQPPKVLHIVNQLTRVYAIYINLYLRQIRNRQLSLNNLSQNEYPSLDLEEPQEIGNIDLSSIKAVLRISVCVLSIFGEFLFTYQNDKFRTNMISLELSDIMGIYINTTIDLFYAITGIIEHLPKEQFKFLEDRTSNGMHETVLGIYCILCDTIIRMVEHLQQIQEQSENNLEEQLQNIYLSHNEDMGSKICINGEKWSEKFFEGLKNKQIIAGLNLLIGRKLYTEEYINELYSQSKFSTYILTSIFSCHVNNMKQDSHEHSKIICSDKQAISYEKYRKNHFRNQQSICLELDCLKIIEAFLKNYGIKVDSEDNLQIRYLCKIGDGSINHFYYQRLAGCRSYVR